jgi:hypothetical protein
MTILREELSPNALTATINFLVTGDLDPSEGAPAARRHTPIPNLLREAASQRTA